MLVLARHGRTRWNVEGRFQGWADLPLDDEGRRQSWGLARSVAAELDAVTGPITVCSSDLCRATETAKAVAEALGAVAAIERDLREVDVGSWEGLTVEEVMERFPHEYRDWAAGRDVRRGGGETLSEAGQRVADCIETLSAAAPGALVVIGHGMSLQAALRHLAGQGRVNIPEGAPHLGNAEHFSLTDWRHDKSQRLLPDR